MADRLDTFRAIPLFADLDDEALLRIIAVATEFEAAAGHVLVEQGLSGSGMFVLEEGTVMVERGTHKIRLGPGEFFGEIALVTDAARAARVRAETPIRCLAIGRNDFTALLHDEPSIAISMLGVLARRLADAMES